MDQADGWCLDNPCNVMLVLIEVFIRLYVTQFDRGASDFYPFRRWAFECFGVCVEGMMKERRCKEKE